MWGLFVLGFEVLWMVLLWLSCFRQCLGFLVNSVLNLVYCDCCVIGYGVVFVGIFQGLLLLIGGGFWFECVGGEEGWYEVVDDEVWVWLLVFVEILQQQVGGELVGDLLGQVMVEYQGFVFFVFCCEGFGGEVFQVGVGQVMLWLDQVLFCQFW